MSHDPHDSLDPGIRQSLEALLTEFSWRADHAQGERLAELFTATGRIVTPMFTAEGREAIAAHFRARAVAARTSRHLWSNFRLESATPTRVRAVVYILTFLREDTDPGPAKTFMVGDSFETFERDADGLWRFAERRLVVAFPPDLKRS
jgi:hypothetical protein